MRHFSMKATTLFTLALTTTFAHAKINRRCQAPLHASPPVSPTSPDSPSSDKGSNSTSSGDVSGSGSSTPSIPPPSSSGNTIPPVNSNYTSSGTHSSGSSAATYKVVDQYAGSNFFDAFDFNNFADPTHGNVKYVNKNDAVNQGLAYVQKDGVAVIKVDNTSSIASGGLRPSVRISSKKSYDSGLFVLDVQGMPFGCGVWPAFWMVGPNWPAGGEIDIVEGVNNNVNNQYTIHANPGCKLDTSFKKATSSRKRRHHSRSTSSANGNSALAFTGTILSANCDATTNSNTGCGVQDPSDQSYGSALNAIGGGVFATLLNEDGVAIWFFPRYGIPSDLLSGSPQPASWGSPRAFWSSSQCPSGQYFKSQQIVINTTLCGDWAGSVYQSAGCPGTCADRVANPRNFDTAQWKIHSVTIYDTHK